jgi:hypothetical protein
MHSAFRIDPSLRPQDDAGAASLRIMYIMLNMVRMRLCLCPLGPYGDLKRTDFRAVLSRRTRGPSRSMTRHVSLTAC